MLIGEFASKLTDKNRLAIPKKFRDEMTEGLIISRGYEGCLILLDNKRFSKLETVITKEPILNLSIRDTKRFLLGGASEVETDSQGRFVLSTSLQEYAQIKDEVIFLGLIDWVEIWNKERWQTKLQDLSKHASDIADKLSKLT